MTTKTTSIQAEVTQAEATYHAALRALAQACAEFNNGAGKTYAELLERHAELRKKIAAHEAAAGSATQEFKRLLAASNYEKTKAVKDALFTKNDAQSIAEELREALADSERTALPIRASASRAAEHYATTHDAAYGAYARLEAYKALAECEEALSKAMALLAHVPDPLGFDQRADDMQAYRMKFVADRLTAVALERPEALEQPEVEALGVLELGPFTGRAYLTPVQALQLQRAEDAAAA
ncbi:hypothetical protein [Acidovorax sp. LjRoot194]|uniref:hypothetical protein n=1 Tax=Acidovorax sp. LjRoot194 TaxID=3342280 RepID=UPI003ECEE126